MTFLNLFIFLTIIAKICCFFNFGGSLGRYFIWFFEVKLIEGGSVLIL
jgi:hypothetical protein